MRSAGKEHNSIGEYETVEKTTAGNYYGCVQLVESGDNYFLMMDDCTGPTFEGPLSPYQIVGFYNLFCEEVE